jgi:hypothetical protein
MSTKAPRAFRCSSTSTSEATDCLDRIPLLTVVDDIARAANRAAIKG